MCDSTSGRGLCDLWCVSVRFFAFTDWRADKQCRCSLELLVSRTFELSRTCTLCGLRPESVCLERLQALPWSYLLLARPMVTCTCNIRLHFHVVARCCNRNIYFFTAPFSGSLVCDRSQNLPGAGENEVKGADRTARVCILLCKHMIVSVGLYPHGRPRPSGITTLHFGQG